MYLMSYNTNRVCVIPIIPKPLNIWYINFIELVIYCEAIKECFIYKTISVSLLHGWRLNDKPMEIQSRSMDRSLHVLDNSIY